MRTTEGAWREPELSGNSTSSSSSAASENSSKRAVFLRSNSHSGVGYVAVPGLVMSSAKTAGLDLPDAETSTVRAPFNGRAVTVVPEAGVHLAARPPKSTLVMVGEASICGLGLSPVPGYLAYR